MTEKYSPSTLFVTFIGPEREIESSLDDLRLFWTRVSGIMKRYAVEVPYGQEDRHRKMFENELWGPKPDTFTVTHVSSDMIKGKPRQERPKKQRPAPKDTDKWKR